MSKRAKVVMDTDDLIELYAMLKRLQEAEDLLIEILADINNSSKITAHLAQYRCKYSKRVLKRGIH